MYDLSGSRIYCCIGYAMITVCSLEKENHSGNDNQK